MLEEIRLKQFELANKVQELLIKFNEEVGQCEIGIETKYTYHEFSNKMKRLTSINVKVNVII